LFLKFPPLAEPPREAISRRLFSSIPAKPLPPELLSILLLLLLVLAIACSVRE
jgi:hypothetical protein